MRLKYSSLKHELGTKFVYWKIFNVCTSKLLLKRGAELYVKFNLADGIILYISLGKHVHVEKSRTVI